MSPLSQPNE